MGSLVRLMQLESSGARLVEVTLAPGSPAAGTELARLGMPREATVVAVVRRAHVVVPRGDTVLEPGDEVLVLVSADAEDVVRSLLVADAGAGAGRGSAPPPPALRPVPARGRSSGHNGRRSIGAPAVRGQLQPRTCSRIDAPAARGTVCQHARMLVRGRSEADLDSCETLLGRSTKSTVIPFASRPKRGRSWSPRTSWPLGWPRLTVK